MTRKIILSRKGFDSKNGGVPSAFVPDEEMVSFPIPVASDLISYDNISAEGMSLRNRMRMLHGESFAQAFPRCHHDPDLVRDARARPLPDSWRGVFGQAGAAQGHLRNNKIGEGDLFLFFGWFREAERGPDGLRFRPPDLHALFGYLQVEKTLRVKEGVEIPECFSDHPHVAQERMLPNQKGWKGNTLYVGAERLSFPGAESLPGWGVFRHSPELVLTADGADSRTIWNLPDIFRNRKITYHAKKNPWRSDGLFQSRPRGQEFIVFDDEDETVSKWAANLIRRHHLRS